MFDSLSKGQKMGTQAQVGELEVSLLRMFLTVVDRGSIGKAATAVDMTQPAVSQQMLRLERIVGQKLFARGRNGITLTRHGEILVTYANRAVELNDETLLRLRERKVSEQVVIGCSADVAFAGLVPGLARLQTIRPELELKIVVETCQKLNAMLRANDLDLVIAGPNDVTGVATSTWRISLHWAARRTVQVAKSRSLPLVLLDTPGQWRRELLDSLRLAEWEWRISFESPSLDAILSATQTGLGVSVLPMESIRMAKLICLSDAALPPSPTLEFGIFSGATLSNAARMVLEAVRTAVADTDATAHRQLN